jgi:hypothetical protein
MPLDTARLIDSDLFALSTGDEFKAAVALWCKSWTQKPAASLPNDDRILSHLSSAGGRWKKIKPMALRGWVLCDDGRLYHPVIAEKALEAWEEREQYQDKQDNEKTRLQNFRAEHKALRIILRSHGIVLPFDTKIDVLRERVSKLPETNPETETETQPETETFQDGNARNAPAMAKTGTGQGQGLVKSEGVRGAGAGDRQPGGTPEDGQLPAGVDPERWASYRDQLADDGKLSISRIKTAVLQLHRVTAAGHDANAVLTAAVMRGLRDLDDCAARLAREKGSPPPARGGPRPNSAPQPPGKTAQAIQALEDMKHGSRLDIGRDPDRDAETAPALARIDTGR